MEVIMQIETVTLNEGVWNIQNIVDDLEKVNLVTVFGDTNEFILPQHYEFLRERYPHAHIVGCSSAGNIEGEQISDSPLVVTAVRFDSSSVVLHSVDFVQGDDITLLSQELAEKFDQDGLKHIFILSDGLNLNGSELIKGFNGVISAPKTGGLAGDGAKFERTFVMGNAPAKERVIVAIGFYGDNLKIGSGCYGGWSEFGTQRVITRSKSNVLYELDGEPALDLYKRYLGEYADDLPNSGLRFPLSIKDHDDDPEMIRTLLAIDEETKSITFAGDVPEGFKARLMKPNVDLLIDGAGEAANLANMSNGKRALGLIVSCVGRKVVMGQLVDEELEVVADVLGESVVLTGFYSYGEIAPFQNNIQNCQLHNQTMTLTVVYED
jgi:hypothetical protein